MRSTRRIRSIPPDVDASARRVTRRADLAWARPSVREIGERPAAAEPMMALHVKQGVDRNPGIDHVHTNLAPSGRMPNGEPRPKPTLIGAAGSHPRGDDAGEASESAKVESAVGDFVRSLARWRAQTDLNDWIRASDVGSALKEEDRRGPRVYDLEPNDFQAW